MHPAGGRPGVNLEELLTEPAEVTRWGIALASVLLVLIAGLLAYTV